MQVRLLVNFLVSLLCGVSEAPERCDIMKNLSRLGPLGASILRYSRRLISLAQFMALKGNLSFYDLATALCGWNELRRKPRDMKELFRDKFGLSEDVTEEEIEEKVWEHVVNRNKHSKQAAETLISFVKKTFEI